MCIIEKARSYLLSFDDVDDKLIDMQINQWKSLKKNTITDIYKSMLHHSKNRQGMPNSIGEIERLSKVFFNFDPKEVACNYSDYRDILIAIEDNKIKTAGVIRPENVKSHWVVFAKASISSAKFINQFDGIEGFNDFIHHFYRDENTLISLPLLLKEELFGFGFALACDFLKENGYEKFVKPDTHLNDICRAAGITDGKSDYKVFKDITAYCNANKIVPYEFDKLIWLVGSGRFYLSDVYVQTKKNDFIKYYL
ncbi:MAG: hypothetical protein IBX55_21140 [Methyloprofundus sp.]|nr:hypothetical protein [Methyloprofundus sp.]